jgi:hypothetical protein
MNTAPASGWECDRFRRQLRAGRQHGDVKRMEAVVAGARYGAGDLQAEADDYRIHFRGAVQRPHQLEQIIARLRVHFTEDTVLTARAIEQRLYEQTWLIAEYDKFDHEHDSPGGGDGQMPGADHHDGGGPVTR